MIAAYDDVLVAATAGLVRVDGSGDAEEIAARVREALGL